MDNIFNEPKKTDEEEGYEPSISKQHTKVVH